MPLFRGFYVYALPLTSTPYPAAWASWFRGPYRVPPPREPRPEAGGIGLQNGTLPRKHDLPSDRAKRALNSCRRRPILGTALIQDALRKVFQRRVLDRLTTWMPRPWAAAARAARAAPRIACCLESSTALLDSATRQWVEELSALPNINTGALHLPVRLTLERVAERAVRTDRQPPIPPPKGRQVTNEWDGGDGYL